MSSAELARGKVRPLPTTMRAALDELQKDEVLLGSMEELLARCYLAVRRAEDEEFSAQDEDFEIRNHFYRF
jgi:glutamine synthetase